MNSVDDTATVVRRHINAVRRWRMPDMVADYADDAVVLVAGQTIRGTKAIEALFTQAQPITNLKLLSETFDGPIALIVYGSDQLSFASDTFVVRDGRINFQTIAFDSAQKA